MLGWLNITERMLSVKLNVESFDKLIHALISGLFQKSHISELTILRFNYNIHLIIENIRLCHPDGKTRWDRAGLMGHVPT